MESQLRCVSHERALLVKKNSDLNGIDYIEVVAPQTPTDLPLLLVFCFKKILKGEISVINAENIRIEGGVRIKNIGVKWAKPYPAVYKDYKDVNNVLVVCPTTNGDFSSYTLRLVDSQVPTSPISGFDPYFSSDTFSFKIDCPSDFDCAPQHTCLPQANEEPAIDYMAKDYASFRQLMFDRLSLLIPEWKERNPADLGVTLVELLAYVGDQLSYFQDAVANEAYLGTALKRVSVRRHARLLDYRVHEGCNSRAWVVFKVSDDLDSIVIKRGTRLIAGGLNAPTVVPDADFERASADAAVFETMHNLVLYIARNELQFYTWGEPDCCLPKGATHATVFAEKGGLSVRIFSYEELEENSYKNLENSFQKRIKPTEALANRFGLDWLKDATVHTQNGGFVVSDGVNVLTVTPTQDQKKAIIAIEGSQVDEFAVREKDGNVVFYANCLRIGDVLVFQEARSPTTGRVADGDPARRCAVRLTKVAANTDSLISAGNEVLEVFWDSGDALPFPLCLHKVPDPISKRLEPASVVYGNVVLADHGYTKKSRLMKDTLYRDKYGIDHVTEDLGATPPNGLFRPKLVENNITFAAPYNPKSSANSAFQYDARAALPSITILGENQLWQPKQDLLSSYPFAADFVAEVDNDGTATVRFGDGEQGRMPLPSTLQYKNEFFALYRVGNGKQGNVGRETLTQIVNSPDFDAKGIFWVRNPMEAQGGRDPEDIQNVQQYAPRTFRAQERAVTEDDYEEVLQRHPGIQKAHIVFKWTGSWYTAFVAVDRSGGLPVDNAFKQEMVQYLERFRLSGYDLEITEPVFVPLEIQLQLCLASDYLWGNVEKALLDVFSNRILPNGERGFFHPDNFTFGQIVYLSRVIEVALKVPGVSFARVKVFNRYGKQPNGEIQEGKIEVAPSEIVRLDNDFNFPENGSIKFDQVASK
jgi:hypothetical protein